MKMSKSTLSLLKNFSSINPNLLVKPGSNLKTIASYQNIMAEATVTEDFPIQFGIWDLSKFLGVISMIQDPDFDFFEKYVVIRGKNGARVKYYYSDPKVLTATDKSLKMPPSVVDCCISEEDFKETLRAASVLQLPDIKIESESGKIVLKVCDQKDPTSNQYSFDVGDTDSEFSFGFKAENFKMLPDAYDISICETRVARFRAKGRDLIYYIAMESKSPKPIQHKTPNEEVPF